MLPVLQHPSDLLSQLHYPDFSQFGNPAIYMTALTLAVVASLKTLLSVEAVDKMDPYKRVTSTNRELIAQGIGNACSGLLGGLPLAQVIVRSFHWHSIRRQNQGNRYHLRSAIAVCGHFYSNPAQQNSLAFGEHITGCRL